MVHGGHCWGTGYGNEGYCTILFNSAGIVTRDGPTKILVSADTQSDCDMANFFSSLLLEAAKICAYRSVKGKFFGRFTLGAVMTITFGIWKAPVTSDCRIE